MVVTASILSFVLVAAVCISANFGNSFAQSASNTVNDSNESHINSVPDSSQSSRPAENPLRSILSRGGGLRLPNNRDMSALIEAFQSGNVDAFTPPPINNPNCYVEVPVVQRVPGQCIRLGNGRPACQTQHMLSLNSDECT